MSELLDEEHYCPICKDLLTNDREWKRCHKEDHKYTLYDDLSDRWYDICDGLDIVREYDTASVWYRGESVKDYDHRPSDEELLRFIRLSELLR
jgi:uncharacterized protein YbaR (Trm112 family)